MAKIELSRSDEWELEHKSQDVRGWEMVDANGQRLGTVRDLIIDTERERVDGLMLDGGQKVDASEVSIGDHVVRLETPSSFERRSQLEESSGLRSPSSESERERTSSLRPSSIEDPSLRESRLGEMGRIVHTSREPSSQGSLGSSTTGSSSLGSSTTGSGSLGSSSLSGQDRERVERERLDRERREHGRREEGGSFESPRDTQSDL